MISFWPTQTHQTSRTSPLPASCPKNNLLLACIFALLSRILISISLFDPYIQKHHRKRINFFQKLLFPLQVCIMAWLSIVHKCPSIPALDTIMWGIILGALGRIFLLFCCLMQFPGFFIWQSARGKCWLGVIRGFRYFGLLFPWLLDSVCACELIRIFPLALPSLHRMCLYLAGPAISNAMYAYDGDSATGHIRCGAIIIVVSFSIYLFAFTDRRRRILSLFRYNA